MTKENFTPSTASFEGIIDNSKKYIVPKYQRDYSWCNSNDEWELLWEDIVSSLQFHYVGILVLQENKNEINIVDGQQRLTTISLIILSALYLLSEYAETVKDENERKNIKEQLDILMQKYIGRKAEDLKYYNKITLNINNKSYFSEICNIQGNVKLANIPKPNELTTNKNIYKCVKYFYEKLNDYIKVKDSDAILEFIKNNITEKLIFTTITVSQAENAYLLFETLNSRSIELTSYDLLKNHLLSKAGIEYEKSMLEDLNLINSDIGSHDITNFIALDWNSCHTPKIPLKRVYRIISSNIDSTQKAFEYIAELKNSSKIYKVIKNYDVEDKEIKEMLKILTYLPKVKQHYMILISIMKSNKYSLKNVLKEILNITIRYNYIYQGQANRQETLYSKIANKISKGEYESASDIIMALKSSELEVTNEEFINKFSKKQFNNEALDCYILAKIEEYHNTHTKIDYDNESVEHIMDKNMKSEYTNRIGNLTLLTKDDNQSLSGKTYDQKREFYVSHPRKIVNMINDPKWEADEIEARSIELATIANKIFK